MFLRKEGELSHRRISANTIVAATGCLNTAGVKNKTHEMNVTVDTRSVPKLW